MTIEEKVNIIKENQDKNNLFISPRAIKGGAHLIHDAESLELYEHMEENTQKYAEEKIIDLMSKTREEDSEATANIPLTLIFEGNFEDFPSNPGPFSEFIEEYKDKIVAVYTYVKSSRERGFFVGFYQTERINEYGYIYLRFGQLLDILKSNGIKYEIDNTEYPTLPGEFRDTTTTRFDLSYTPKKDNDKPKTRKRTIKNSNN